MGTTTNRPFGTIDWDGLDRQQRANMYLQLGNLLHATGDLDGAKRRHEDGVAYTMLELGKEHSLLPALHNELCSDYIATRDWASALEHGEQALRLAEAVHGADDPRLSEVLLNVANAARGVGDRALARRYRARARALRRE